MAQCWQDDPATCGQNTLENKLGHQSIHIVTYSRHMCDNNSTRYTTLTFWERSSCFGKGNRNAITAVRWPARKKVHAGKLKVFWAREDGMGAEKLRSILGRITRLFGRREAWCHNKQIWVATETCCEWDLDWQIVTFYFEENDFKTCANYRIVRSHNRTR